MRTSTFVRSSLASPAALAVLPSTAAADGPIVGPSTALVDQVWSPAYDVDYVVTKEPDTTLVQARDTTTRAVVHELRLQGQYGLPRVTSAADGLGGLSADG